MGTAGGATADTPSGTAIAGIIDYANLYEMGHTDENMQQFLDTWDTIANNYEGKHDMKAEQECKMLRDMFED